MTGQTICTHFGDLLRFTADAGLADIVEATAWLEAREGEEHRWRLAPF